MLWNKLSTWIRVFYFLSVNHVNKRLGNNCYVFLDRYHVLLLKLAKGYEAQPVSLCSAWNCPIRVPSWVTWPFHSRSGSAWRLCNERSRANGRGRRGGLKTKRTWRSMWTRSRARTTGIAVHLTFLSWPISPNTTGSVTTWCHCIWVTFQFSVYSFFSINMHQSTHLIMCRLFLQFFLLFFWCTIYIMAQMS